MLFQDGRREMALPYIKAAAERGDPRAEYLLGIAHFNGDLVAKDWIRAYALMTLANGTGLPQAPPALAQMDQYIPLAQRQAAASLATKMQQDADATRARQLASADLSTADLSSGRAPTRVPAPIQSVAVTPSSGNPVYGTSASAAIDATRATGTESPAEAGADFARPVLAARPSAPALKPAMAAVRPAPSPVDVTRPAAKPVSSPVASAATGPWRVQLGAFGVAGNAERLWGQIGGKGALAGKSRILEPAGKLTKLYAGGFASQADAAAACETLRRGGQSCLVTR